MRPETCTRCGEEVRYGTRNGRTGWWHREPSDHAAIFGVPSVHPSVSAELKNAWLQSHADFEQEEASPEPEPIPDPEIPAHIVEPGDPDLPGGAATILKLARKHGWETVATHSRGPWLHGTHWTVTGIYDYVLVRADRDSEHARAFWRGDSQSDDWKFEHGWTFTNERHSLVQVNNTELKARIKS